MATRIGVCAHKRSHPLPGQLDPGPTRTTVCLARTRVRARARHADGAVAPQVTVFAHKWSRWTTAWPFARGELSTHIGSRPRRRGA